jgi:hypothetical protein
MLIKMGPSDVEVEAGMLMPHIQNKKQAVHHACIKH